MIDPEDRRHVHEAGLATARANAAASAAAETLELLREDIDRLQKELVITSSIAAELSARPDQDTREDGAEAARAASEDARQAAEVARHAAVDAVRATADALNLTLEQMKVVEEMRRMLRESRKPGTLDSN